MQISIEKTSIKDLIIVKPEIFRDERGFFSEVYRKDQFEELGVPSQFVQLNHSASQKNVLRGLHFQGHPLLASRMEASRKLENVYYKIHFTKI